MIWSPQQQAFLDWCRDGSGSCVLEAVAGAGKTTVLIEAGKVIRGQVGYMVYNKKNADEAKVKITKAGMDYKKMQAGTAHSFGCGAYRKARPNLTVDENKVRDITDALLPRSAPQPGGGYSEAHPLAVFAPAVVQLVSLAKQTGIGIPGLATNDARTWLDMAEHFDVFDEDETPIPAETKLEVVRRAAQMLKRSTDMMDLIDFDDMIYMPLYYKVRFWQFEVVMIDEAQDTNATRRALVRAMLRRGGRVIAVGDRCQPVGTKVERLLSPGTRWAARQSELVDISEVKVGDTLTSFSFKDGVKVNRKVEGVSTREYRSDLVVAETATGLRSRYTLSHKVVVKHTARGYAVYLMGRNESYRVGVSKLGWASNGCGPMLRMRAEGGDRVWIVSTHPTRKEALVQEARLSVKYGVSMLCFRYAEGNQFSQKDFDYIWGGIHNENRAVELLADHGRNLRYPYFEAGIIQQSIKRPHVVRACNVLSGSLVKTLKGPWVEANWSREAYSGEVVSLDVEKEELYYADGILTHNCQAIYGFTGADSDALDLIAQDHNCARLPLTVTYRCPKQVVAFARQWVSHIEAHESAPVGSVSEQRMEEFLARNDLDRTSAVLSRTTKPLVALAFRLLRQRTPCRIEGRDVGGSIKKLMQRWKVKNLTALETKLEAHLARETTKLLAAKKEAKLAAVEDAVETVRVIIAQCRSESKTLVSDAVAYVDEMFADGVDNVLTLSTIHKSKGREWERVFWLDRTGTCPSKWARQEWQQNAEVNLMYVAATRAQSELIDLIVEKEKVAC